MGVAETQLKGRAPSRTKVEKGNKASALNDLKKKRAKANQAYVGESSEVSRSSNHTPV